MHIGPEIRRFISYGAAGGLATLAHYAVMVAIVRGADGHELMATSIGFCVGACVKYPLNYRFVFRSDQPHGIAVPRFLASLAGSFALNGMVFWILFEKLGVFYLVAQVFTTAIVILANYAVARLWVFRRRALPFAAEAKGP